MQIQQRKRKTIHIKHKFWPKNNLVYDAHEQISDGNLKQADKTSEEESFGTALQYKNWEQKNTPKP